MKGWVELWASKLSPMALTATMTHLGQESPTQPPGLMVC